MPAYNDVGKSPSPVVLSAVHPDARVDSPRHRARSVCPNASVWAPLWPHGVCIPTTD